MFLPTIYSTYYALLPFLPFAADWVKAQGLNHRTVLVAVLQVSVVLRSLYCSVPLTLPQWIWMTRCVRIAALDVHKILRAICIMMEI